LEELLRQDLLENRLRENRCLLEEKTARGAEESAGCVDIDCWIVWYERGEERIRRNRRIRVRGKIFCKLAKIQKVQMD
jgi:hypothetical protein